MAQPHPKRDAIMFLVANDVAPAVIAERLDVKYPTVVSMVRRAKFYDFAKRQRIERRKAERAERLAKAADIKRAVAARADKERKARDVRLVAMFRKTRDIAAVCLKFDLSHSRACAILNANGVSSRAIERREKALLAVTIKLTAADRIKLDALCSATGFSQSAVLRNALRATPTISAEQGGE